VIRNVETFQLVKFLSFAFETGGSGHPIAMNICKNTRCHSLGDMARLRTLRTFSECNFDVEFEIAILRMLLIVVARTGELSGLCMLQLQYVAMILP
jgi:hypothetical protein